MKSDGSHRIFTLSDMTCSIPVKPSDSYFFKMALRLAVSDTGFPYTGNFSLLHCVRSCPMLNSETSYSEKTVISVHAAHDINTYTVFLTSGRRLSSKRRSAIFLSDILFHNGYVIVLEYSLICFDLLPLHILLDDARHGKHSSFRSDSAQIYPYS